MGTLLHRLRYSCILLCIFWIASPPLPAALAQPIQVPDFTKCELATDTSVVGPVTTIRLNCCLPIPAQSIVNFSFRNYQSVRHVRQAAQTVSDEYIATYNRAYELMKALPEDDPRSFHTQANIHCAFCNFAYRQLGDPSVPLQVHFSWLFLAWHRWYIYFHERILQSLLGDPTFALVFWNWDDQETGGNVMPAMFVKNGTALYDANRDQSHLPPAIVALVAADTGNNSVLIKDNLNAMHQGVVTATTPELFIGGTYVTGTDDANSTVLDAPLGGRLENGVHNAIHFWTGDPSLPLLQDMGTFSTAARDPIFFAHHSNVDRLWDVWRYKLPGGPRADYTDPNFLNAEFAFYDETGRLVKVTVADALDNSKLGISYPNVATDQQWINYSPNATTNGSAVDTAVSLGVSLVSAYPQNATMSLGSRFVAIVEKPAATDTSGKTEVLVVQGLRIVRDDFTSIRVFVNSPYADNTTDASSAEYLGSFDVVAATGNRKNLMTNAQFEIGDNLRRIGIDSDTKVVITLVKVLGTKPVTIDGLLIKYV